MTKAWDLVVIGGGTAGIVGAKTAARLGARVLLVEQARTGGDCLWTGCVPSKALLAAAHAAADARTAAGFGVHAEVRVDFGEVMAHVHAAIARIEPVDSPAALVAAGVAVRSGRARFVGPDEIDVGGQRIRFAQALIATGSRAALPPIDGLAGGSAVRTSDTIWDLRELPRRLVVLGGGSVGCELGQAFARLGSDVTIVEQASRLLPGEDADASELVRAALVADGVQVRTATIATSVGPNQITLSGDERLAADVVLVAVGRVPGTRDLGPDAAGVALDGAGHVVVDEQLRTSNPSVWAAGDVTRYPGFTHVAGVHASIAAGNAVLGLHRTVGLDTVPRVTFTRPEVAAFGANTAATVRTIAHEHVDRAVAEADTDGFSRLVLDRRGRIVGATIVGPRAGESLPELVLAARQGLRARDLAGTMHAYPTYGDGAWNAAIEHVRHDLSGRAARLGVAALRWWRRARTNRRRVDAARRRASRR